MKKQTISIKSIAAELKISITTVSFVLNGKAKEKNISQKVTEKVLDYVQKVGYKPNQTAKSLRTGKSNVLVFMVEDISNNFFSQLARTIEEIAFNAGYTIIFCSNKNSDERAIELINLFKNRQVDGFIIVPSPGIKNIITELIAENFSVILLIKQELEIVTLDDNDFLKILSPPITDVSRPVEAIGVKVMEIMLRLLNLKDSPKDFEKFILPAELVTQESSMMRI